MSRAKQISDDETSNNDKHAFGSFNKYTTTLIAHSLSGRQLSELGGQQSKCNLEIALQTHS